MGKTFNQHAKTSRHGRKEINLSRKNISKKESD
jgi:hypothetical protein